MRLLSSLRQFTAFGLLIALGLFGVAGCENKEKVLDVETPGGQVEVTRDRDTGDVDVNATDKETMLDINTPGADVEIQSDGGTGSVDVDATRN